MSKVFFFTLLLTLCVAKLGFDASSGPFSVTTMQCMKNTGYSFAIFRGYQQIGRVDPNVVNNIKAALAGGISDVGAYVYPCVKCGNPSNQIIQMANALKELNYNTIWIDVERQGWDLNDKAGNRKFLTEMFNEAPRHGKAVGVYTSSAEWSQIVGNDWTVGAKFPLWWPRWDNKDTLDNFVPFAGWNSCMMKQYFANTNVCGIMIDGNFKK